MTPDLGLESPMIVAQSPAAKTSGCDGDRSVPLTATKPRGSVARPLCAIHEGAPAPVARAHRDAALTEDAPDPAAHARVVAAEDAAIVEQRKLDGGAGKYVLHGKQHLDSARAAADHRDAPDLAPPRRLAQALPAGEKTLDRSEAKRVP